MNQRILAAVVLLELGVGIYYRWTLPGPWGPVALAAALFLMGGTFAAWGRLEALSFRRKCQAGMMLLRTAQDPWRAYELSKPEIEERMTTAAVDTRT